MLLHGKTIYYYERRGSRPRDSTRCATAFPVAIANSGVRLDYSDTRLVRAFPSLPLRERCQHGSLMCQLHEFGKAASNTAVCPGRQQTAHLRFRRLQHVSVRSVRQPAAATGNMAYCDGNARCAVPFSISALCAWMNWRRVDALMDFEVES